MREESRADGGKVGDAHDRQQHLAGSPPHVGDGRSHQAEDKQRNDEFQQLRKQRVEGLEDAHQHFRGDKPQQRSEGDGNQYPYE